VREAHSRCRKILAGLTAFCMICTPRADASNGGGVLLAAVASAHPRAPALVRDEEHPSRESDAVSPSRGAGFAHGAEGIRLRFAFALGVPAAASRTGDGSRRAPDADASAIAGSRARNLLVGMKWADEIAPPSRRAGFAAQNREVIVLAQNTEAGLGVDTTGPASAGDPGGAPPPEDVLGAVSPSAGKFAWTLAPLRWGGNLVTEIRMTRFPDQARRLQQVENGTFRAGSYIWQPWFAQVTGGIGFVTSRERGGTNQDATGTIDSGNDATTLTGNGTLAVFPTSRFPFQAMFDVSDSRASGEITGTDYTSARFGLRQSYRPLRGDANYTASYDRSTLSSTRFPRDIVDVLAGDMTKNLGAQTVNVSGSHSRNRRGGDEGSTLSRLTGQHSYRPDSTLSVTSLASASSSEFRLLNNSVFNESGSRFLQLNTFATWRPAEGDPLFVTGGGRVFQSDIDSNGVESEARSMSGNVAASYALNRNTNLTGSASITQTASNLGDDLFTAQAAGLAYSADVRKLGNFTYTWNAAGNASNFTGGAQGAQQQIGGQVAHALTRSLTLRENSVLTFNLGQGLGSSFDRASAQSQALTHNASVSWRFSPAADTMTYFSLTGADSRTTGHNENEFQLINAQATGQIQFNRYSFGAANYTVQGTRQETPAAPAAGFNFSSSGSISYQHARAIGVPRLRYSALYNVNEAQFRSRLLGDVTATRETVTQSFEQRLDYNVGRIDMRLTMRVADIDGRRNSLIFFRLSRQLGDF